MRTTKFIIFILLFSAITCNSEKSGLTDEIAGSIIHIEMFSSKFVAPRNVDIWLPPSYEKEPDRSFPVVYMHDGQNLFNPETSYIGVVWGVDEAMIRLIGAERAREAIIVGIWNTPKRFYEYMPSRPIQELVDLEVIDPSKDEMEMPLSDEYLKFIVHELKTYIDQNYRTDADKHNTFIMGSSMGGLISLYAVCEYPDVFGGAGCVSTHWPAGNGIVLDYLKKHLPVPGSNKFYFDYGTETLDSLYEPFQIKADAILYEAGYTQEENWITRKFEGHEHSERSWRERVHIPLEFLIGK